MSPALRVCFEFGGFYRRRDNSAGIHCVPALRCRAKSGDGTDREKTGGDFEPDEENELEEFLQLEHILILAKAQARRYLAQ